MRPTRVVPLAALLAIGVLWGMTIPLTKVAVSTGHQPLGLIFWQLVVAVVVLGLINAVRRQRLALDRRTLRYCLMISVLGTIAPNSFSYIAAVHLPAGVLGIVLASVPMFVLGIALGIGRERLSARRAGGVMLGATAVVVLIAPETSLPGPDQALFVLVALVAPLCYATESNYIDARAPAGLDAISVLLGASFIGAMLVAPVAWVSGGWINPFSYWGLAESALLASALCHAGAYTGYIALVSAAGAVFASQVSYVVTVSAVFLSTLLLGESYSVWVWAALVLMIGGLALVQPRERASSPAPEVLSQGCK